MERFMKLLQNILGVNADDLKKILTNQSITHGLMGIDLNHIWHGFSRESLHIIGTPLSYNPFYRQEYERRLRSQNFTAQVSDFTFSLNNNINDNINDNIVHDNMPETLTTMTVENTDGFHRPLGRPRGSDEFEALDIVNFEDRTRYHPRRHGDFINNERRPVHNYYYVVTIHVQEFIDFQGFDRIIGPNNTVLTRVNTSHENDYYNVELYFRGR